MKAPLRHRYFVMLNEKVVSSFMNNQNTSHLNGLTSCAKSSCRDADCSAIKASLALPCLVKLTISDWHTFDLPLHSLFSTASLGLTRLDIDKDVKAPLWNSSYKKVQAGVMQGLCMTDFSWL